MKKFLPAALVALAALASAAACSSSGKPAATASAPPPTPTPSIGRINPNVVEETATYIIERYPKKGTIRVDDRHFRNPIVGPPAEFFKEDEEYYYVKTDKLVPEEVAAKKAREEAIGQLPVVPPEAPASARAPKPPLADYESITPPRVSAALRLEEVPNSGLPDEGYWRSSFAVADMNGDGIPDIVATPPRLAGSTNLTIWLGDGTGHFKPWTLRFLGGDGKELAGFGLDYGGVAIGDVDGDGRLDVVTASHTRGIFAFFGDGKGTFVVTGDGFLGGSFSAQAVALADLNGDGKLDVIAATDKYEVSSVGWQRDQAHAYLYAGNRSFKLNREGILDASFSNSAVAWDFDGDGRKDVLLGSQYFAAVQLLFKNQGDGTLAPVAVPDVEVWAYHFAVVPGTFGKSRAKAFADLFYKGGMEDPDLRVAGINLHVYRDGRWEKHVVWREKGCKAVLRTVAVGDLDGDGLDDVVFPDTFRGRLRIFFQQSDGSFKEADEKDEPKIGPVAQHVELVDLDRDGRLDVVLAKTVESVDPPNQGGWTVFLNKRAK